MPDEDLMRALEQQRGQGHNEDPVRAVWNPMLAGIVFQHPTIESLRRERARNGQLHALVSPAWACFLHRLMNQASLLDGCSTRWSTGWARCSPTLENSER